MCAHIARHLSDTYERVRDFLLLDVSLSSRKLEEVLRTASHEKQRSGRWRGRDGIEERIALVAADAGRPSLAPIHVPQQELQLPVFVAGTP